MKIELSKQKDGALKEDYFCLFLVNNLAVAYCINFYNFYNVISSNTKFFYSSNSNVDVTTETKL